MTVMYVTIFRKSDNQRLLGFLYGMNNPVVAFTAGKWDDLEFEVAAHALGLLQFDEPVRLQITSSEHPVEFHIDANMHAFEIDHFSSVATIKFHVDNVEIHEKKKNQQDLIAAYDRAMKIIKQ